MREICRASSCISDYSINRNSVHVFDMISRTFFSVFCEFATLLHGPNAYIKFMRLHEQRVDSPYGLQYEVHMWCPKSFSLFLKL